MINNILPCSQHTLYEDVSIQPPSSMRDEKKPSEIFQLPHYQISHHRSSKSLLTVRRVCTFARINQENRVEVSEEAIEILESYSKCEIVYCGVYGGRKSGKSTFIDSVLQVETEKERGFVAQGKVDNEQVLKMNILPLSAEDNKKIFFIQYSKGLQSQQLAETSQKLLDLLLFMSDSIVLMVNKDEALATITKHIKKSSKRLKKNANKISYWPDNLYIVNTYKSISKDIGTVDELFIRISLILWIKGQSKPIANFVKDISSTKDTKSFRSINNNFYINRKLLLRLEQQQNTLKQDRQMNIEGMFASVYEELCHQYLLYHYDLYDQSLQQCFLDQKPYQIDYLLQSFQKTKEEIFTHFRENSISKDSCQEELEKLEDYIDQRERLIVEVNKKKNQFELKRELEQRLKEDKQVAVGEVIENLRVLNSKYQHAGVEQYASVLYETIKNLEKNHRKAMKKEEDAMSNRIKQLQLQIADSKEQLIQTKESSKISQMQDLQMKEQQLASKMSRIRRQLQLEKRTHKEIFNSKLSSQQKCDKLLQIVRQLQQKARDNAKVLKDIEKEHDFNPQVERLHRQLQKLEKKLNGQCSKLQSVLNSQIQAPIRTQSKISAQNKEKIYLPQQTF